MAGKSRTNRRLPKGAGSPSLESGTLPAVLSVPPARAAERIRVGARSRITPVARVFIVQCVNSGYNNRQINVLLREKRFILVKDPDLSDDTIARVRSSKDCLLDLAMLTDEARQVGHNKLSALILYWGEVADGVFLRLMRGKKPVPGPGDIGYGMKPMTVGEASALLANATKVMMDVFGADVPGVLKAEREGPVGTGTEQNSSRSPEQMARYIDVIVAASLERVERRMEAEEEEAANAEAIVLGERASAEE